MNNAIEKELLETGVLVLRLNRPEVLNAMNRDLIVGLLNTINETIDDEKVRSIVLTGNGRGFWSPQGRGAYALGRLWQGL